MKGSTLSLLDRPSNIFAHESLGEIWINKNELSNSGNINISFLRI